MKITSNECPYCKFDLTDEVDTSYKLSPAGTAIEPTEFKYKCPSCHKELYVKVKPVINFQIEKLDDQEDLENGKKQGVHANNFKQDKQDFSGDY